MTFTDALKATDRSLKLAVVRAAVRVGAWLAPACTSEFVAGRFFTTDKPLAERTRFAVNEPARGLLQTPDGEVVTYRWGDVDRDPTVVLVHGWNGWAQQMERFVAPLQARGIAVLAFDHVGHGASTGKQSSLPVMIRTVEQIFNTLPKPVGAIGHSLGAAAVAAVLSSTRREALPSVLIAPPSDPRPYLTALARMLKAPKRVMLRIQEAAERIAKVELKKLVADAWTVRRIRAPLLIVHDVGDKEVPIANGYAYTLASRTRVLATDGLGHRRILRDVHVVAEATEFIAMYQPVPNKEQMLIAA